MKGIKWKWLTAVALILIFAWSVCAADVSGISIMSVRQETSAPQMYFEVRALDSTGVGVRAQSGDFRFTAGEEQVELAAQQISNNNLGHIIVVDTSLYYYGSQYIKAEHIQEIVSAYLSRLSADERIMFVLTTDAAQPTCTNYMTLENAKQYVQGITLTQEMSARINGAIYEAFRYAIAPAQGAPMFNTVFIVADPDLENNNDTEHSLSECVQLRANSGVAFDAAVAVPHREQYLSATNASRRKNLESGFAAFEQFAQQIGGKYIQLEQTNKGVETEELHVLLSQWLYTTSHYAVDFSALAGKVPLDPQVQKVPVSVTCQGAGGNAVRTVEVALDTALLPQAEVTPTPDPDVTPAPTPVVAVGQTDATAMQAIYALSQLNYLEKTGYDEFDNSCFLAYIDFCSNNGVDPRDGIYAETYELLLSGKAVGAAIVTPEPTATPEPTPTPVPTVPPEGYSINDMDTEGSGGFIAQIQFLLKSLNCYEEDAVSSVGRLDQATVDAVNRFCQAYNWRNDRMDGISKQIADEILANGSKLNPIAEETPVPTPEPTVPPEGYTINDSDTEGSGGFIASMQSILKNLNCYEEGALSNVGRLDEATINAVNRYCAAFNWRNDHVDGVSKQIVDEILANGEKREPLAPVEPTLQEKAWAFLTREIQVGSVSFEMWIPVAVCVVLFFVIVTIVVLMSGGKKKAKDKPESDSGRTAAQNDAPPASPPQPVVPAARHGGDDEDDGTDDPYFKKFITLYITFAGQSRTEEIELNGKEAYTIGRKGCNLTLDSADKEASRHHAELVYKNDQVYVRDLSSYGNTSINGMRVRSRADAGSVDGAIVNNGDVIQVSNHMITIRW